MQFLILYNLIFNVLCIAGRVWNPDDYIENCSNGYFTEWINYLKRFLLAVLTLSGAILYYIPDSRTYARKGCCLIIDSFADGLKTVLCLKENNNPFNKKKQIHNDSFIFEESSSDFYENVDFQYLNSNKSENDIKLKPVRKAVNKNIGAILKNDVNEKHVKRRRRCHQRHEKSNKPIQGVRDCIQPSNYNDVESRNEYLITDRSPESSAIFSTKNCTSYLISGNPQQMTLLDEKNDVNVPLKLYPVKQIDDERSNCKIYDNLNEGDVDRRKELRNSSCSVAKMVSNAKTVIFNYSGLKSTCHIKPDKSVKRARSNKEYDNKEARIYYERTPRLKEKMNERNAEIEGKEKAAKVKEVKKLLKREKIDGF